MGSIMGWDTAIENGENYKSPLAGASECSRVYAINFMHQVSQQESDSDQRYQDNLKRTAVWRASATKSNSNP